METGTFQIKTVVVAAICLRNRKLSKCAPSISCTKKAEGNQPCQQALAEQFCLMRMELWCGWTWIETTHANNGNLKVKLPTIWTDGKAEAGAVREEKGKRKKIRERQKKEDPGARKGIVFQCVVVPGHFLEGGMFEKCRPFYVKRVSKSKVLKTDGLGPPRTAFGSWGMLRCSKSARRCGKKHISKSKVLKTDDLGPLLEFKMSEKSARHCGAKHVSKSKVLKTDGLGPLLEVEMWKKCTPLWREARFEV